MVGNSDQLSEGHGFHDGWRSKAFHYDIVVRPLSTNSSMNFLWILITQAWNTHHPEKKIVIDMNALHLLHLIVLEPPKPLLLDTIGIR